MRASAVQCRAPLARPSMVVVCLRFMLCNDQSPTSVLVAVRVVGVGVEEELVGCGVVRVFYAGFGLLAERPTSEAPAWPSVERFQSFLLRGGGRLGRVGERVGECFPLYM